MSEIYFARVPGTGRKVASGILSPRTVARSLKGVWRPRNPSAEGCAVDYRALLDDRPQACVVLLGRPRSSRTTGVLKVAPAREKHRA